MSLDPHLSRISAPFIVVATLLIALGTTWKVAGAIALLLAGMSLWDNAWHAIRHHPASELAEEWVRVLAITLALFGFAILSWF